MILASGFCEIFLLELKILTWSQMEPIFPINIMKINKSLIDTGYSMSPSHDKPVPTSNPQTCAESNAKL